MDQRQLRNLFGRFASGVTVITCRNRDGLPHGATVTAFTAVSLEPRLCQVTLTRKSKACDFLSGAPFAVNILASDQMDLALHFAGRPQPSPPRWRQGATAPTLTGTAATFSCIPWREYDGGDHVIFIGEIIDAECADKDPLLFYRSAFHDLGAPTSSALWNCSMDDPLSGWFTPESTFRPLHAVAAAS